MEIPEGYHRHPNGGGLVQDTATVAETAYIGPNARVFGNASVFGSAHVSGDAWNESPPQCQAGRWYCCVPKRGRVLIGCQDHSFDRWIGGLGDHLREIEKPTAVELATIEAFFDLVVALGLDKG